MFIFYGVKLFVKNLGYFGNINQCPHCKTSHKSRIIKTSKWIHIMFIPCIPIGSSYTKVCPICFNSENMKKSVAKELMNLPDNNQVINTYFYHRGNNKNGYEIWTQDMQTKERYCIYNNLNRTQIENFKKNMGLKSIQITEIN